MTTHYLKIGETQELEQFKKASSDLARRAQSDEKVAHDFLQKIGYFKIMSESKTSRSTTRTSPKVKTHQK